MKADSCGVCVCVRGVEGERKHQRDECTPKALRTTSRTTTAQTPTKLSPRTGDAAWSGEPL